MEFRGGSRFQSIPAVQPGFLFISHPRARIIPRDAQPCPFFPPVEPRAKGSRGTVARRLRPALLDDPSLRQD